MTTSIDVGINPEAQKLIRDCVAAGQVSFSGHGLEELSADGFTTEDALRGQVGETMRKCLQCGASMVEKPETRHYDESGLKGILLVNVPVARCTECDEYEVDLANVNQLHRLIALAIVRKPTGLTGPEIRFLRKHLGWTGEDFAARLDVTPTSLSRWENGRNALSRMAERLIRLMVIHQEEAPDFTLDDLRSLPRKPAAQIKLRAGLDGGRWKTPA